MDSVTARNWYGFTRFSGPRGAKAAMQEFAAKELPTPVLQLQVTEGRGKWPSGCPHPPGSPRYGRGFVALTATPQNISKLANLMATRLHPARNHVNEIIKQDTPVKVIFDFDSDVGLPGDLFPTRQDFCEQVQVALTSIMASDFGIQLNPTSLVWLFTDYTYKKKFSAHLVIHHVMSDGSLVVVPSQHHTERHAGSRYFLDRLIQELPHVEAVRDYNIYSRDREMRLPYACKHNEDHIPNWTPGTLMFADSYRPFADALVKYFGDRPLHVLQLPTVQPARSIRCKGSEVAGHRANGTKRVSPPAHLTCSDVEQLVVDCLREKAHPTVYMCIKGDIYDRWAAPRFTYSDRSELCWCGHTHDQQHFAAWVVGNEVYAHCFSDKAAAGCSTVRIGHLEDDFAEAGDLEVCLRFLAYEPGPHNSKEPVAGVISKQAEPLLEKGQRSILQYAAKHHPGVAPSRQSRRNRGKAPHKHKVKPALKTRQQSIRHYFHRTSPQATRAPRAVCVQKQEEEPVKKQRQQSILSYVQRSAQQAPLSSTAQMITQYFSKFIDQLLSMEEPTLCIQSAMGTGKTFLLQVLIRELDLLMGRLEMQVGRPARVCVVTYRTALSLSMMASLEDLGFINYLDVKGTDKLQLADKCIVQLDSIGMVMRNGRVIPHYDLVVLDESESTLHHTTAKTHGARQRQTFDTFCSIVKHADRVLVMDALLGRETRAYLRSLGRPPRVVRNTWRSDKPRVFEFTNDQDTWVSTLVARLRNGQNCAVASMSATKLQSLKKYLVAEEVLKEEEVLIYDSHTNDDIKRQVRDVNKHWVLYRLVMWSPAVEAGVDFNVPHFHSMFVIISNMSTVAMGEVQSQGRIRTLENQHVLCWCLRGVAWDPAGHEMRPEDAVQQLRWHQDIIRSNCSGKGEGSFSLNNFATNLLTNGEERLENGQTALLPAPGTPGMIVASHNYARIVNSRERLLSEIIKLIEHQGHRWQRGKWHSSKVPDPEVKLPSYSKAEMLLGAFVIEGPEQLEQLLRLQSKCQLAREEKAALARHFFCAKHHIKNAALNAEFLHHHSAEDQDAACLDVLIAALGHIHWIAPHEGSLTDDGQEMVTPVRLRAELLAEVFRALQVDNILACSSVHLTADKLQALRSCKAFRDHTKAQRTFNIDSRGSSGFDNATAGSFAKRLSAMIERSGLKAKSSNKKIKGTSREYTLCLDAEQQQSMAKLVKLAAGRHPASCWSTPNVYTFLQNLQLGSYEQYAQEEGAWFGGSQG